MRRAHDEWLLRSSLAWSGKAPGRLSAKNCRCSSTHLLEDFLEPESCGDCERGESFVVLKVDVDGIGGEEELDYCGVVSSNYVEKRGTAVGAGCVDANVLFREEVVYGGFVVVLHGGDE